METEAAEDTNVTLRMVGSVGIAAFKLVGFGFSCYFSYKAIVDAIDALKSGNLDLAQKIIVVGRAVAEVASTIISGVTIVLSFFETLAAVTAVLGAVGAVLAVIACIFSIVWLLCKPKPPRNPDIVNSQNIADLFKNYINPMISNVFKQGAIPIGYSCSYIHQAAMHLQQYFSDKKNGTIGKLLQIVWSNVTYNLGSDKLRFTISMVMLVKQESLISSSSSSSSSSNSSSDKLASKQYKSNWIRCYYADVEMDIDTNKTDSKTGGWQTSFPSHSISQIEWSSRYPSKTQKYEFKVGGLQSWGIQNISYLSSDGAIMYWNENNKFNIGQTSKDTGNGLRSNQIDTSFGSKKFELLQSSIMRNVNILSLNGPINGKYMKSVVLYASSSSKNNDSGVDIGYGFVEQDGSKFVESSPCLGIKNVDNNDYSNVAPSGTDIVDPISVIGHLIFAKQENGKRKGHEKKLDDDDEVGVQAAMNTTHLFAAEETQEWIKTSSFIILPDISQSSNEYLIWYDNSTNSIKGGLLDVAITCYVFSITVDKYKSSSETNVKYNSNSWNDSLRLIIDGNWNSAWIQYTDKSGKWKNFDISGQWSFHGDAIQSESESDKNKVDKVDSTTMTISFDTNLLTNTLMNQESGNSELEYLPISGVIIVDAAKQFEIVKNGSYICHSKGVYYGAYGSLICYPTQRNLSYPSKKHTVDPTIGFISVRVINNTHNKARNPNLPDIPSVSTICKLNGWNNVEQLCSGVVEEGDSSSLKYHLIWRHRDGTIYKGTYNNSNGNSNDNYGWLGTINSNSISAYSPSFEPPMSKFAQLNQPVIPNGSGIGSGIGSASNPPLPISYYGCDSMWEYFLTPDSVLDKDRSDNPDGGDAGSQDHTYHVFARLNPFNGMNDGSAAKNTYK